MIAFTGSSTKTTSLGQGYEIEIWTKIAEKFDINPFDAEKKFKNLRTAYGWFLKKKKMIPLGSGKITVPISRGFSNPWGTKFISHLKCPSNPKPLLPIFPAPPSLSLANDKENEKITRLEPESLVDYNNCGLNLAPRFNMTRGLKPECFRSDQMETGHRSDRSSPSSVIVVAVTNTWKPSITGQLAISAPETKKKVIIIIGDMTFFGSISPYLLRQRSNSPLPGRRYQSNSLLPGHRKWSNARGLPGKGKGDIDVSIWSAHNMD